MELKNIIFVFIFLITIVLFVISIKRIISTIKLGQKENRFDKPWKRLINVITIAFGQKKLLREPVSGVIHFFIFWGFILLIFAVIEAIVQGFYSDFNFSFLGYFYSLITLVQDVFGILVIIAIIFSFYRRFILRVKRLQVDKKGKIDAAIILSMILVIVLSMFLQNITHVAKNNFILSDFEFRPVTIFLSNSFFTGNSIIVENVFEISWWIHILFILGFLNFLPYSKHLHVLTSIPNVYFSKIDKTRNELKPINLTDESIDVYGADDIDKLSWKQILDGFSCTECGRCTSVCPAATVGKSLSPRKIIIDIRHRAEEKIIFNKNDLNSKDILEKKLIRSYISDKELWQCTTCNACVQECPVMIEHIDAIIDLRRYLVLSESDFPSTLNSVFKNLESNNTPWAFNQNDRINWTEGLNIKTLAEDNNGEILFWVGCAGSFDSRYQKVSIAFAKIMQKAKVDFRILGNEEICTGDAVRRLGNEYLAQQLIQKNVETLNNYGVKKIVTACPHCLNSIKRDFKQFGGNYDVIHHSQFIEELLVTGRIELKNELKKQKVTYHDSCYLGRYNDIYSSPRNSIKKINGLELIEMQRNKSRGLCCGAGGGQMFLEDNEGTRINIERTKEAIQTGADTITSACPFCLTMLTDGLKAENKNEDIFVKDIAEIILENSK